MATLAMAIIGSPAVALATTDDVVLRRDEEAGEVAVAEYDDDLTGDTGDTGNTGGDTSGDSNDATGSRHTGASRDRDRSRGDKTRDWTRDGTDDRKRDWSGGHTNDSTRNDTR
ncbi:MAG TPA: hypothetical protein VHN37_00670 [Actinomycetota bacterium]|nr:hypothetical protein [Actinomycetota bacterium]